MTTSVEIRDTKPSKFAQLRESLLALEAAQVLLCHLHPAAYIALSFSLVALLIQLCAVATARDRLKRSPPSETVEELLRQIAHGHRTARLASRAHIFKLLLVRE